MMISEAVFSKCSGRVLSGEPTDFVSYVLVIECGSCSFAEQHYSPFPTLRELQTLIVDLVSEFARRC